MNCKKSSCIKGEKGERGLEGDKILYAYQTNQGNTNLFLNNGKQIYLGNIKGTPGIKGDKGEPGNKENGNENVFKMITQFTFGINFEKGYKFKKDNYLWLGTGSESNEKTFLPIETVKEPGDNSIKILDKTHVPSGFSIPYGKAISLTDDENKSCVSYSIFNFNSSSAGIGLNTAFRIYFHTSNVLDRNTCMPINGSNKNKYSYGDATSIQNSGIVELINHIELTTGDQLCCYICPSEDVVFETDRSLSITIPIEIMNPYCTIREI